MEVKESVKQEIVLSSVALSLCLDIHRATLKGLGRDDLFPQTEEGANALMLKYASRIGG